MSGNVDTMKVLIQQGANVNAVTIVKTNIFQVIKEIQLFIVFFAMLIG